jgi:two-component system, NtrC family, sensor kinase
MQQQSDDGAQSCPGQAGTGPDGPTVLIVDDTPANLGVLVDYLEDYGFQVVVAQDGAEGLQRAQYILPDLILLDVTMPGMDGVETCRRLKALDAVRDIPVMFMTALTDTRDKLAAFAAGGVDYVTKPFQIEEVRARIHTHLALRTLQLRLTEQNHALQLTCAELEQANLCLAQAQAQMLQTEKMASIGLLAAGVAHEINNPLGFVSSNLSTLGGYGATLLAVLDAYEAADALLGQAAPALMAAIRGAKDGADLAYIREDLPALLAQSCDGLGRAKKIVADLREFSHVGETPWQLANLHHGLDSTLNIVAPQLKSKATLRKDYGALPDIVCKPLELNQVFLNLLLNAAYAIEQQGEIRIATGVDGDGVWIEIADTGCGIAPAHLARIFDPFFTTKPVGQGTGLGLSLSYATVKRHGGRIEVSSAPGAGSTFRIHLPLRTQPAVTEPAP